MVNKINLVSKNYLDAVKEYSGHCIDSGFVIDNENKQAIENIAKIFTEKKRGVLLIGKTGSGKTVLMQMFKEVTHPQKQRYFIYKKCKDIVKIFNDKEIGYDVYDYFKTKNVMFDDLGTEDMGNNYGIKVEVFQAIIQERYDLYKEKGYITHFTTNMDKEMIKSRYGERCASRLGEMCEVVFMGEDVGYTDRRKYKNYFTLPQVNHIAIESKEITEIREIYEALKLNPVPAEGLKTLGERAKEKVGTEINKTETQQVMEDINSEFKDLNNGSLEGIIEYQGNPVNKLQFLQIRINELNNITL